MYASPPAPYRFDVCSVVCPPSRTIRAPEDAHPAQVHEVAARTSRTDHPDGSRGTTTDEQANNQQLAFSNTIEAIIHGANRIDATMGGMGRGAGNCAMELLLGFLRNPKFNIRPVWKFLQEHVVPLRATTDWGALPPYIIAGQLNQHPRAAIAWLASDQRDNCLDFFDKATADV